MVRQWWNRQGIYSNDDYILKRNNRIYVKQKCNRAVAVLSIKQGFKERSNGKQNSKTFIKIPTSGTHTMYMLFALNVGGTYIYGGIGALLCGGESNFSLFFKIL